MSLRDRLPPGQVLTDKLPVVGEDAPAPGRDPARWTLRIDGAVEKPMTLDIAQLVDRSRQRAIDAHCVTGWSRLDLVISGVPLGELLGPCMPTDGARYLRFEAHSTHDHDTTLPLDVARAQTWIVHAFDGEPLDVPHGGPIRAVTPGRYFYKSVKWLRRVELMPDDRLGFWERESAYHNNADPWQEQRFDDSRVATPEQVAELREARSLDRFRGDETILRARLGGWRPTDRDLSRLSLKDCSLRRAQLAGCRFESSNLSLCNLDGAELSGAQFAGADLEGASFVRAGLREAVMDGCALTATRFVATRGGRQRGADVEGMRLRACSGLLEDQRDYLVANGALIE